MKNNRRTAPWRISLSIVLLLLSSVHAAAAAPGGPPNAGPGPAPAPAPAPVNGSPGANLDLDTRPPGSAGLPPNVLVAIDNSGSMDLEVLFPTTDGGLYWNPSTNSFVNSSGDFNDRSSNSITYFYLFPNGCVKSSTSGVAAVPDGRVQCDQQRYYGLPPFPQFGFARSAKYNKSYFNPKVSYKPWPDTDKKKFSNSQPNNAPFDPMTGNSRIDLTVNREVRNEGNTNNVEFYLSAGMVIPAGVSYYHSKQSPPITKYFCVNPYNSNDTYEASRDEVNSGTCNRHVYGFFLFPRYNLVSTQTSGGVTTGFFSEAQDQKITTAGTVAISYFPATFYVANPATELSSIYDSYKKSAVDQVSTSVGTLYRYQIKPENFTNPTDYTTAIQNFANWFTYDRKRHLALRGSVVNAFKPLSNGYVSATPINNLNTISMSDLDDKAAKNQFLENIYDIDFSENVGTPNRAALQYLGNQLRQNPNIIRAACQRNYAILFTDGFNSNSPAQNVGNVDKNSRSAQLYGPPFPDNYSNTIADVAMEYYENLGDPANKDIKQGDGYLPTPAGCDQNPPDPSLDCEKKLHLTTFGVTLGQTGIYFDPDNASNPYKNPPSSWPDPGMSNTPNDGLYGNFVGGGGKEQIDDLWHATLNTRGKLLDAESPDQLANSFTKILNEIAARESTLTNSIASSREYLKGSEIFQTNYSPSPWTGDLIAYDAVAGNSSSSGREWSAAAEMPGFGKGNENCDDGPVLTSIRSNVNANSGQITPVSFGLNGLGSDRYPSLNSGTISYLRGYRGSEQSNGGPYRDRGSTILGDIVHAVPSYVGPPNPLQYAGSFRDALYPNQTAPENAAPYYNPAAGTGFAARYANRRPMVYVGANDGMLHGFDASSKFNPAYPTCGKGRQLLAYVPNAVLDRIAAPDTGLQNPNYTHQYFVDGQTTISPAFVDGQWRTMLVGGLRGGGRSFYALDVTDPDKFKKADPSDIVKWEFQDSGLGYTYGTPVIARLHNGQWAAIFGNGYNSADGGARLYIVNIATGALIRKLDVGTGAPGPNGLASPTVLDLDNDHIADYVYAGDYQGNVWKFDLTAASQNDWTSPTAPLFKAVGPNGDPQPITSAPVAIAHPYGSRFGAMVYVGTGEDIANSAGPKVATNSVYGIWDPDVFSTSDSGISARVRQNWQVSRSQLLQQTLLGTQTQGGLSYRLVSSNPINFGTGQDQYRGWVFDLPANGEAILSQPTAVSRTSRLEFSTTIRNRNTCATLRSGFVMALDLASGGSPNADVFDVNGDGVIDEQDRIGLGGKTLIASGLALAGGGSGNLARLTDPRTDTARLIGGSTTGGEINVLISDAIQDRRRSWREVRQ